ncbi:MAG: preprotein translocase subunit SecY [Deltaproteobacteria bacterium]|nr:preprotein translocase subunit SecY [Candidatus Anaeroferrophillus wilburensis]MBN2889540.1 preprotein translocase subunit SecY [Deltaproteobacteria bacterium]
MLKGMENIGSIPELQRKIGWTFFLLFIYRVGIHVPTPGIDGQALASFFAEAKGTLLGMFDMFAGGGLSRLSVFSLGIMPYISASIIIELLAMVIPTLERLKKEGEAGRRKIVTYTRYGTILLSTVQSFGIAVGLESMQGPAGEMVVMFPGWGFRLLTVITLTSGTAFIMWIGEQITERGIGNGISLIIFAGIVARTPAAVINTIRLIKTGEMSVFVMLMLLVLMTAVVAIIVFVETGQRRVPIQYAKRVVGRKMYGGQSTHLPIKVNTAGVIPPIFASSIIMFPATIANFIDLPIMKKVSALFMPSTITYNLFYVALIFAFCYFYTAVTFKPDDVADNLKKYGGYVPGIRPGKKTAEYLDRILTRLTFWGAVYVSVVCVLPMIFIGKFNVPFYFGGTALLIIVGVGIDTIQQIQSHLIVRNYDGLMKKGARGRR